MTATIIPFPTRKPKPLPTFGISAEGRKKNRRLARELRQLRAALPWYHHGSEEARRVAMEKAGLTWTGPAVY